MTYQFVAALVQALDGRVQQVRIDRAVEETSIATVEVDGPPWRVVGRCAAQRRAESGGADAGTDLVAPEVLHEAKARRAGDSHTAARLRPALAAPPMTVGTVGM
jgi:hypothetical protein